jgi:antirestriction protein
LTTGQFKKPSPLVYDDKGAMLVNEQIMNSYNSGSINKRGLHSDLSDQVVDDDGAMMVNEQLMNSYSSGSINKFGLHGELFGPKGTKTH